MQARIHAGEREAILLAEELKAEESIMDYLTGRREAERRQLRVTGTVGVVRAAARIRAVPAVWSLLAMNNIPDDEFFVASDPVLLSAMRFDLVTGELADWRTGVP